MDSISFAQEVIAGDGWLIVDAQGNLKIAPLDYVPQDGDVILSVGENPLTVPEDIVTELRVSIAQQNSIQSVDAQSGIQSVLDSLEQGGDPTAEDGNDPQSGDDEGSSLTATGAVERDGAQTIAATDFQTEGLFPPQITVEQSDAIVEIVVQTVALINSVPSAADDTATTLEDTPITIDVLANDADSDGDKLSIVEALVSPEVGVVEVVNGELKFTPAEDYVGPVEITYTISDGNGGSDTATVAVVVEPVNDLPIAFNDEITTDEDSSVASNVPAATDVDGTVESYQLASDVDKGSLTFNGDGSYSFDPNGEFEALAPGESEEVTFTYTATDNNSGVSEEKTITITVNGVNDIPVALDGSIVTDEDTSVGGNVPAATDVDGTVESYQLASDVDKGSLTFNGDGSYSFDPNGEFEALAPGESEEVTFTYTATDNNSGVSEEKTITITVNGVNDIPVALDGGIVTDEDTSVEGNVPAATDVDGTIASYQLVSDVNKGSLTFNADGSYSFDPAGDFDDLVFGESDEVTFTYTATDNNSGVSEVKTIVVTVNGINDAPEFISGNDQPGDEPNNDSYYFVGLSKGSEVGDIVGSVIAEDPDGDALIYSFEDGTYTNGVFDIDPSTGNITLNQALTDDFEYDQTFTVLVTDTGGLTDTAEVRVQLIGGEDNDAAWGLTPKKLNEVPEGGFGNSINVKLLEGGNVTIRAGASLVFTFAIANMAAGLTLDDYDVLINTTDGFNSTFVERQDGTIDVIITNVTNVDKTVAKGASDDDIVSMEIYGTPDSEIEGDETFTIDLVDVNIGQPKPSQDQINVKILDGEPVVNASLAAVEEENPILAGLGEDILVGTSDSDSFTWNDGQLDDGTDVVQNFTVGEDSLNLNNILDDTGSNNLDELLASIEVFVVGEDITLDIAHESGTQTIVIEDSREQFGDLISDSGNFNADDILAQIVVVPD
ncbi:Ig-like domain-containing protein [Vibrio breoganii]